MKQILKKTMKSLFLSMRPFKSEIISLFERTEMKSHNYFLAGGVCL